MLFSHLPSDASQRCKLAQGLDRVQMAAVQAFLRAAISAQTPRD